MLCRHCSNDKLSREFPSYDVTDNCDHPSLICMECVIQCVKKEKMCPYPGCEESVNPDSHSVKMMEASLGAMFTVYESTYTPSVAKQGWDLVHVTVLTGESISIPYYSTMTVLKLKDEIKHRLNHDVDKQKLNHNNNELTNRLSNGKLATLSDFNVPPNTTVYLMVLLYSIPEAFDHVVFDLHWGYPISGRDYLDASCLVYNGTTNMAICDFRGYQSEHQHFPLTGLWHSGDVMDAVKRIGHHTINVHLKKIPSNVTKMYFTLSAWCSPNISRYPNPSLKFYQADNPTVDLCKTTFTHASSSQAVIMCSLSRDNDGKWQIYESGKLSSGNARNYAPMNSTIVNLINSGY
ncbi:uncharacterized protein LOC132543898 [Ylistrum balloti]|uniref:uncharacterized protein LOC132543898 n=1 Tax=Ylistrum balloti TaxID=509963 RepID=UPI002905C25E|nr:uncharacterized protein LOC132543898 [Ylistrum balloti]XP_060063426.1 uncharacterized protein LOC132543898 [Ylistrum balloti]